MTLFTRIMKPLAVLTAVLLLGGCVRCLHPIYTSSDVVFNEKLIGTWKQPGKDDTTWQFTESKDDDRDRGYRLVVTDKDGYTGAFLAHLAKLGDDHFLDLYPIEPKVASSGFYKFHFQRIHTFYRVQLEGDTFQLASMKPDWLEKHLQSNPEALDHTFITPKGHLPTGDEGGAARRMLVTASTAELQAFLRKHVDNKEAFADFIELNKIK